MDVLTIAAFGLASGLLIGCVGIGGVILVPALTYVCGIEIHRAIGAIMAAYIVSGVLGTLVYWRNGSIPWRMASPLCAGAIPAALIGTLAAGVAPATVIEGLIGILTTASALNALRRKTSSPTQSGVTPHLTQPVLVSAGVATGLLSAMSGAGGPLVLVPILTGLACPVLISVGVSQVIQIWIALVATGANLATGGLDFNLAAAITVGISAGTWAGAKIAHTLPQQTLRIMVATVLLLTGLSILIRVTLRLAG